MKLNLLAGFALACMAVTSVSQAQQAPAGQAGTAMAPPATNYDYHETFGPLFYAKNGSEYRAADGEPGPKYWQNRADYQLAASLDDQTNTITGSEVLTYTNNSPQNLSYLWMNLEQNLFKLDSRGSAIVPLVGNPPKQVSRNWGRGQDFDAGYKIKSIKMIGLKGAMTDVKFLVSDTRMQVYLPKAVTASGGQVKLKIEYSFISPNYGSDRMGIQETKNGKIFQVAQWYPRMCVYDDVYGWNTIPYTGPGEFYSRTRMCVYDDVYGWNTIPYTGPGEFKG